MKVTDILIEDMGLIKKYDKKKKTNNNNKVVEIESLKEIVSSSTITINKEDEQEQQTEKKVRQDRIGSEWKKIKRNTIVIQIIRCDNIY